MQFEDELTTVLKNMKVGFLWITGKAFENIYGNRT